MKKVAIVSCYFQKNYGSMLQAYATQKIMDEFGVENETIDISELKKDINSTKIKHYMKKITDFDVVKGKLGYIKLYVYCKIYKNGLGKDVAIRKQKFESFVSNFNLSTKYMNKAELTDACKDYAAVVVGSDQLWLPSNIEADFYTLNFVPNNVKKVSYATSFGVSSMPAEYINKSKNFLNRIDYLSVREQSGQKLIKELTGRKATCVCDPTLLFTAEDWMCIQKKERFIKDKYIFCYFLGNNPEQREFAKKIKKLTGFKIVALKHLDEYIKSDNSFADIAPYDIGPSEFLNLIRNAEYICTDSFHGTVFSMLNRKKFFTFRRFSEKTSLSTNTRMDSLFDIVKLKERMLTANEDVKECMKMEIDYDAVHGKLGAFRDESKKFLKNALGI